MKTVVNNLGAELTVTSYVQRTSDLRVTISLTNESSQAIRLNAMDLNAPSLTLKFIDSFGKPVPTGPPPVPMEDDGRIGRINLLPGKPLTHTYEGNLIFGSNLNPGVYSVYFIYSNEPGRPGEWRGTIQTDPVRFEITGPNK